MPLTPLKFGIVEDHAHGLGVGLSEPEPPRFLVEGGFRDGLLQHLAVEAEGAGLIRRQRTAELAADLLQLVGVELAELVRSRSRCGRSWPASIVRIP